VRRERDESVKALVTGSSGFIGSHLVERLRASGDEVRGLDITPSPWTDFVHDIRHQPLPAHAFKGVDVVFHLAANPEVRESFENPAQFWNSNVIGTLNVLEAMRKTDAKAISFASTSAVYASAYGGTMMREYDYTLPSSIYGWTKLVDEEIIHAYETTYGIGRHSLRLANIIGSRDHHGLIWDILNKVLEHKHPIVLLGDGLQVRSYLHVKDAVNAFLVTTNPRIDPVLNVGNDDYLTVKQVANVVLSAIGRPDQSVIYDARLPEGRGWVGDIPIIRMATWSIKACGWAPSMTSEGAVYVAAKALGQELGIV
jgi:UDP-glucose 4-epimerase